MFNICNNEIHFYKIRFFDKKKKIIDLKSFIKEIYDPLVAMLYWMTVFVLFIFSSDSLIQSFTHKFNISYGSNSFESFAHTAKKKNSFVHLRSKFAIGMCVCVGYIQQELFILNYNFTAF